MKTPEQLKGAIRNFAAKNHLRALDVQHMFMFERILERLAVSPYAQNFILKGGLLISSMIGVGARTTMDMDTTVRGIQLEEEEIVKIFNGNRAYRSQKRVNGYAEGLEGYHAGYA